MALVILLYIWPVIVVSLSILSTLLHSFEEIVAENGPIWSYLGLTTNPQLGFFGLFAFALAQIGLAAHGYLEPSKVCLWILAGIRLGDVVISHWIPRKRPNPGFPTSFLYLVEGIVLIGVLSWDR